MRTWRPTLTTILALLAALTIASPAAASIPQPSPEIGSIGPDRAELLSLLEPVEIEPDVAALPCISERYDLFSGTESEADPLATSFFTSALDHFALEIGAPADPLLEIHERIEAIALVDGSSSLRPLTRSRNFTSGLSIFGDRSNVRGTLELAPKSWWGVDNKAAPFVEPAKGLVYLRARWYDPGTGTFLTPDPLGYRDSSNLYAFAAGDPVNRHDPTGLESIGIYQRQRDLRSLSPVTRESERLIRQESRQAMIDALANPYVQGSLQVVGGCSEAVIGGVAVFSGVGTVPGAVAAVHGSDICFTGFATLLTGETQETLFVRGSMAGLQAAGMDPDTARWVTFAADLGLGMYGSIGSGMRVRSLSEPQVQPSAILKLQKEVTVKANRTGAALERWMMSKGATTHPRYGRWVKKYQSIMTNPSATAREINFAKGLRGRFLDRRINSWMRQRYRSQYPGMRLDRRVPGVDSALRPDVFIPEIDGYSVIFDFGGPSKLRKIGDYEGFADVVIPVIPESFF